MAGDCTLISLVNDAIEHETAAIHGATITREGIDSFKQHVNEQTKAPEILQVVISKTGQLPNE